MLNFGELKEGPYPRLYFFIQSCLIFISSFDRGIPSLAAEPVWPSNFSVAFRESRFDQFLLIVLEVSERGR